jgi:hypothetical protein
VDRKMEVQDHSRENVRETLSTNKPSVVAVTRDASYKPCRQEDHGNVDLDKNEKP